MSHFYGSIMGASKTPATRRGHKSTVVRGYVQTHECGIEVDAVHRESDAADVFHIWVTGGRYSGRSHKLATVTCKPGADGDETTIEIAEVR